MCWFVSRMFIALLYSCSAVYFLNTIQYVNVISADCVSYAVVADNIKEYSFYCCLVI